MTTAEWRRRMRRRLSGVAWGALLLAVGAAEGAPQGGGPAIQTVSPEEGPAGTEVVIRGEDFGLAIGSMQGTSGVSFGGVWASPEFWSEGEIRVEVPAGAESGPVAVTVGGVASDGVEFTVTAGEEAGPAIGTVSPGLGPVGTEVVVRGTGFGSSEGVAQGISRVSFNGIEAEPEFWSEGEIRVEVPAGAESGPVAVAVGGVASRGVRFTVTAEVPAPVIAAVSPEAGPAGAEVVIRGEHFGEAAETSGVSFGGVWAKPTLWSEGEIRAAVPEGAPSGPVAVTVGGEASGGVRFSVTGPAPVIETVDPTHGPEGTGVVIRGLNFGSATGAAQGRSGVSFDGVAGEVSDWSEGEIRAVVPAGAESGLVAVRVGSRESNGVDFTVPSGGKGMAVMRTVAASAEGKGDEEEGPEITSLSPEVGPVGTAVVVRGTGFGAVAGEASKVSFNGVAGVVTSWSETEIRVPAPAGAATGPVTVTARGKGSNGVRFGYEDPPILVSSRGVYQVQEPDGALTIEVVLPDDETASQPIAVTFDLRGTATHGTDYTMASSVTIPTGAGSATTTLSVEDDAVYEGTETIEIWSNAPGYSLSFGVAISLEDDELPPLEVIVSRASVSEPDGSAAVTVRVPEGAEPAVDTTVTLELGGTAEVGSDYTLAQTLTLGAGERKVVTTLAVVDDEVFEGLETIEIRAGAAGYEASALAEELLYDDDYTPLTVTADPASVSERDGQRTAAVTVSVPAGEEPEADARITFSRGGTAKVRVDYTLVVEVTLEAGERSVTATLEVLDDAVYEGEETIVLHATGNLGTGLSRSEGLTISLEDDELPPLMVSADPPGLSEQAGRRTATLTVSVPAGAEPETDVRLSVGLGGTATHRADYQWDVFPVIRAGETSGTSTFTVVDDTVYEGLETIRITYVDRSDPRRYQSSSGLEIGIEDDELPPLRLEVAPTVLSEEAGRRTAAVTVSVEEAADQATTVTLHHPEGGTATAGSDYRLAGSVEIPAGGTTVTATLTVQDDEIYEGEETVGIRAGAAGYRDSPAVTVTIGDDELPPLTLEADRESLSEPSGTATVTVSVPEGAAPEADVEIPIFSVGTALEGDDYRLGTVRVTIPAGERSVTVTLTVIDDEIYEGEEEITLRAFKRGYEPSPPLTIPLADDELPPLRLEVDRESVSEPDGTATLTVSVPEEAPAPPALISIAFNHTGAAERSDYRVGTPGAPVTIPAGERSVTVTLTVIDDEIYEGEETITLQATASPGQYQDSDSVSLTLADDELPPLRLEVDRESVSEPEGTATVTVSVAESADQATTVTLHHPEGGTATAGSDYRLAGSVVIPTGGTSVTATLTVADDTEHEGEETVGIRAGAAGYDDSETVTVTIESDDPETPEITAFAPDRGRPGDRVTISGHRLGGATEVRFDQVAATGFDEVSGSELRATVPEGAETGPISVVTPGGTATSTSSFTVLPPPQLSLASSRSNVSEGDEEPTAILTVSVAEAVDEATTVTLNVSGTAVRGRYQDYTLADSVTIPAGGTSVTATLTVVDDSRYEGEETIVIRAGAAAYRISEAVTVTVESEDLPGITPACPLTLTEDHGTEEITVLLAVAPSEATTLTVAFAGSAARGSDYTLAETVTIAQGQTSADMILEVIDDRRYEGDETIDIELSADGYQAGFCVFRIQDNDPMEPPLTLTVSPSSVSEQSGQRTATLTVSAEEGPEAATAVTLTVGGTAARGSDYTLAETLTLPARESEQNRGSSVTATLQVIDDLIAEGDETVGVTASAAGYSDSEAVTVTLQDDDDPGVTLTPTSLEITEGTSGTYQVRLDTQPTAAVTLTMSKDNDDVGVTPASLSFTTATGVTGGWDRPQTVTVRIAHDEDMDDESGTISHSSTSDDTNYHGSAITIPSVSVSVTDDEVPGVTVSPTRLSITEGSSKTYRVWLDTQPTAAVTLTMSKDNDDVGVTPASLTFSTATGVMGGWDRPQTVTVQIAQDDNTSNESGTISHSSTSDDTSYHGSAIAIPSVSVSVTDDDEDPDPSCGLSSISNQEVVVGQSKDVSLSSVCNGTYEATSRNTNVARVTVSGSTLTITGVAAGMTTVDVEVSASGYADHSRSFKVTVVEPPPVPGLSISPTSIVENGGSATVTATLSYAVDTATTFTLTHPGSGSADSSDYTLAGSVTIPANSTQATTRLTANDNSLVEGDKTIEVSSSTTYGNPSPVTVTIVDDDEPSCVISSIPDQELDVGEMKTLSLTVNCGENPTVTVSSSANHVVAMLVNDDTGVKITGKSAGTARVTVTVTHATIADLSAETGFGVTVVEPEPCEISSISDQQLDVGEMKTLSLTVNCGENPTVTVSSSANHVVAMLVNDDTGVKITGKSAGTARVTVTVTHATIADLSAETGFGVTVVEPEPCEISSTSNSDQELDVDESRTLSLTVNCGPNPTVTVSSSANHVTATLVNNDTGVEITGESAGTAKVTVTVTHATIANLSAETTFDVTVVEPPCDLSSIDDQTLSEGDSRTLSLTVNCSFSSESSDTAVVTVSDDNSADTVTITGKSAGTATVTVTASETGRGSVTKSFDVTVSEPPSPDPPAISSISPALRKADEPVTIYGSRFGSTAGSVSFGGHNVGSHNFTGSNPGYSWSNTSIGLLIPSSSQPGTVSVTVTTSAGQTSDPYSYTITGDPLPRSEDECDDEEGDCPDETKDNGKEDPEEEEEESEDPPGDGG